MPAMSSALYENPANPWEMIDTPLGRMEAWRASTLMTGHMGATETFLQQAMAQFQTLRNDSVSLKDEMATWAAELTAREEALNERAQAVADFAGRAAQFYEKTEELYNQLKAEAKEGPPVKPPGEPRTEDDSDSPATGPAPAADLHAIPPKEEPAAELEEEPEQPSTVADTHLLQHVGKDNALPEELVEPPIPEPKGTATQTPVAISLNTE
jgi:hypothetical protein